MLTVSTLAKLCIAMSFASAYVYTSEAYPTSIINAAVGFCVAAGRLGGTVAPTLLVFVGPSPCDWNCLHVTLINHYFLPFHIAKRCNMYDYTGFSEACLQDT